jgi:hypothetical protein
MPSAFVPPSLSSYLPELVAAVRAEAERAAVRTVTYLDSWAIGGGELPPLSADDLLTIAAKLTLIAWYDDGLCLGRDLAWSDLCGAALMSKVLGIYLARTAWAARPHLDVDIQLDAPDEDELIDRGARLIWACRHTPPRPDEDTR